MQKYTNAFYLWMLLLTSLLISNPIFAQDCAITDVENLEEVLSELNPSPFICANDPFFLPDLSFSIPEDYPESAGILWLLYKGGQPMGDPTMDDSFLEVYFSDANGLIIYNNGSAIFENTNFFFLPEYENLAQVEIIVVPIIYPDTTSLLNIDSDLLNNVACGLEEGTPYPTFTFGNPNSCDTLQVCSANYGSVSIPDTNRVCLGSTLSFDTNDATVDSFSTVFITTLDGNIGETVEPPAEIIFNTQGTVTVHAFNYSNADAGAVDDLLTEGNPVQDLIEAIANEEICADLEETGFIVTVLAEDDPDCVTVEPCLADYGTVISPNMNSVCVENSLSFDIDGDATDNFTTVFIATVDGNVVDTENPPADITFATQGTVTVHAFNYSDTDVGAVSDLLMEGNAVQDLIDAIANEDICAVLDETGFAVTVLAADDPACQEEVVCPISTEPTETVEACQSITPELPNNVILDALEDVDNTAVDEDGDGDADISWYTDEALTTPYDGSDLTHSGDDNCAVESQTLYAAVTCSIDGSLILGGAFNAEIYPKPQAPSITRLDATCSYEVVLACPDLDELVSNDFNLELMPGEAEGTATVEVSNMRCDAVSFEVSYEACPEVGSCAASYGTPIYPAQDTICVGTFYTFNVEEDNSSEDYQTVFLFTVGDSLILSDFVGNPNDNIPADGAGTATIHAFNYLIADFDTINTLINNEATASDLLALIENGDICAVLDVEGFTLTAVAEDDPFCAVPDTCIASFGAPIPLEVDSICVGTTLEFLTVGAPQIGYTTVYLIVSPDTPIDASETGEIAFNETGSYTIHAFNFRFDEDIPGFGAIDELINLIENDDLCAAVDPTGLSVTVLAEDHPNCATLCAANYGTFIPSDTSTVCIGTPLNYQVENDNQDGFTTSFILVNSSGEVVTLRPFGNIDFDSEGLYTVHAINHDTDDTGTILELVDDGTTVSALLDLIAAETICAVIETMGAMVTVLSEDDPACSDVNCPTSSQPMENIQACAALAPTLPSTNITDAISDPDATAVDADDDGMPDVTWFTDATLATPYDGSELTHSGADNCAVETQTLYAAITCSLDQSLIPSGSLSVELYPQVQSPTIVRLDDACNYEIQLACPTLDVIVDNPFEGIKEPGATRDTINIVIGNAVCDGVSFKVLYEDCPEEPTTCVANYGTPTYPTQNTFCGGSSFTMAVTGDNTSAEYRTEFLFTTGTNQQITGSAPPGNVEVTTPATFTIHAFNYLIADSAKIAPLATASDIVALINSGEICAHLDTVGFTITVLPADDPACAPPCAANFGTVINPNNINICSGNDITFDVAGANTEGFISGFLLVNNGQILNLLSSNTIAFENVGMVSIHAINYDANDASTLLSIIGSPVADLTNAINNGILCAAFDQVGISVNVLPPTDPACAPPCLANYGTVIPPTTTSTCQNTTLTFNTQGANTTGFATTFIITTGTDLQYFNNFAPGSFNFAIAGNYTVHALNYALEDEGVLSSLLGNGASGFDILAAINNGSLCASLDVIGVSITILPPDHPDCVPPCLANAGIVIPPSNSIYTLGATSTSLSVSGAFFGAGYSYLYFLTYDADPNDGIQYNIVEQSTSGAFTFSQTGNYQIVGVSFNGNVADFPNYTSIEELQAAISSETICADVSIGNFSYQVLAPLEIIRSEILILGNGATYQVILIIGGGSGNYIVNGEPQPDDTYISELPCGEPYQFVITDDLGTATIILEDEAPCPKPCLSEPGEMPIFTGPTIVCGGESITLNSEGTVVANDDALVYVLHTEGGDELGTILATNETDGTFRLESGSEIKANTVYYISAVVGPVDEDGNIIYDDECTKVAAGSPVVFLKPIEFLIDEFCEEGTFDYIVTLSLRGGYPEYNNSIRYNVSGDYTGDIALGEEVSIVYSTGTADTYNFTANFNGLDCDAVQITSAPFECSKTPIELLSFEGEVQTAGNLLKWVTATEINSDFFTIERSTDGETFEGIGTVEAAGNSNTAKSYELMDKEAPNGKAYYRLIETDVNGNKTPSKVITLERGEEGFVINQVYPIPAFNFVEVSFSSPIEGAVSIQVFDLAGRRLYEQIELTQSGLNHLKLDVSNYAQGIYFISMVSGQEKATVRFVKD